jgi:hypothetical protein
MNEPVELSFKIPAGADVRLTVLEQVLNSLLYTLDQIPE